MADEIKQDRRRFLGAAATTIAAAQLGMVGAARAEPGWFSASPTRSSEAAV